MGKVKKNDKKLLKKEYDRKRREELKKDQVKLEEMRMKERLKYKKKKEKGQVKMVAEMSHREHKQKKKQWKANSKQYRQNLLTKKKTSEFLINNSPPDSPSTSEDIAGPSGNNPATNDQTELHSGGSSRKEVGRKRVQKDRSKMYKKIFKLEADLTKAKAEMMKYKKRFYRLKQKNKKLYQENKSEGTPRTKVAMLIGNDKVSPAVRRKLLFGEVLTEQLRDNFRSVRKQQLQKQMYYRILRGNIIKKYHLLKESSSMSILKYRGFTSNYMKQACKANQPRGKFITEEMKNDVIKFLESDDNSRMCPGKKECITRNKVKKQKRLLNFNLQALHSKFLKTVSYHMSYPSFCRLKPFWVVQQKAEDRDTCKCFTHANFELILRKLREHNVFLYANPAVLLQELCCNIYDENCLLRKCSLCQTKKIEYNLKEPEKEIMRKKWIYTTIVYKIKDQKKKTRKPEKKETAIMLKDLVLEFEEGLNEFMKHCGRISRQYSQMNHLKANLTPDAAIIHVDFSENYACKLSEEIQSVHFGGGREQITLHTGVIYMKNSSGKLQKKSFCSLSESNRHDPAAVWAHLKPVFEYAGKQCCTQLQNIHMLSDGPVTQYKNRTSFHIILNHLHSFIPTVKYFTWNFSETSHGKGAPDGIGAVLKRTADRHVAQGNDISCFQDFVAILKEKCPGIHLFSVTGENIKEVDVLLSKCIFSTFTGTLKVHQVVYQKKMIEFRTMSCFECVTKCSHFIMGSIHIDNGSPCLMDQDADGKDEEQEVPSTSKTTPQGNYLTNYLTTPVFLRAEH